MKVGSGCAANQTIGQAGQDEGLPDPFRIDRHSGNRLTLSSVGKPLQVAQDRKRFSDPLLPLLTEACD